MTYELISGSTVTVKRAGTRLEFVTRNPQGEVISSVHRSYAESAPLVKRLRCKAVNLR